MKTAKVALTDRAIKAARPAVKAYDMHDAVVPGLALNVLPSALKRFVLIRRFPGSKHPTRRALGAYGGLTLERARAKARQGESRYLLQRYDGDPDGAECHRRGIREQTDAARVKR